MAERVLHRFTHGLGDAVQFTVVLRHLRYYRPDWRHEVACLRGKHSCFSRLAERTLILEEGVPDVRGYAHFLDHDWSECGHVYPDAPSTKAAQCLREKFGLALIPELLHYEIPIGDQARKRVDEYLQELPAKELVFIHYQGNTATEGKNLEHSTVDRLCRFILELGLTPVILDWDRRSPSPDNRQIYCPDASHPMWMGYGTGDAETLAALLSHGRLSVCIDSGPQKVALTLANPLIAVWVRHHPVHYVDHSPENCLHLVPKNHRDYLRGRDNGYFDRHYRYCVYTDLESELLRQVGAALRSRSENAMPEPEKDTPLPAGRRMKTLIKFTHGLGDAVQLTLILQHLARFRPNWEIDICSLRGKHSAHHGLCHRAYHDQEPQPDEHAYQQVFDLGWWECYSIFADSPSTKACNCLREVFGLQPVPELTRYQVRVGAEAAAVARAYLEQIGCTPRPDGRYNAVVLHYEGNTSVAKKNLRHDQAAALCETVIHLGYVPILLDWDRRSPLPDQRRVHCPDVHAGDVWGGFGTGDAERITALIAQASLMVGIDSGPQKCAGATTTPTIAVWTGHHPLQFFDLADNVTHLVPADHRSLPPAHAEIAYRYFTEHYRFETYEPHLFVPALLRLARRLLGAPAEERPDSVKIGDWWCHPDKADQDWVIINDVYANDAYQTRLLPRREGAEIVVDIGAHIGTFARLWHERNPQARIICVEAAPENIPLLLANVSAYAEVVQAACTYETEPLVLLNALGPKGKSTGGSRVVTAEEAALETDPQYCEDARPLRLLTVHQLMTEYGLERIDLLKLDCEEGEFSILRHAPLEKIGFILGEYHGYERWEELRRQVFPTWDYGHMSRCGERGTFHLRNPVVVPPAPVGLSPTPVLGGETDLTDLSRHERKVRSQNGEDGILAAIFERVGVTNRYYVEFGCEQGTECNTAFLREKGWCGLLMDDGEPTYGSATLVQQEFVTAENINQLLDKYGVPQSFDLLSIDIDGNDYWVWKAITRHPRVVVIEYNASVLPEERRVVPYRPDFRWTGTDYFGASLRALTELGQAKGYTLIYCEQTGVNAFFIANQALPPDFIPQRMEEIYHPPKYGVGGVGHPPDPIHVMIDPGAVGKEAV